MVLSPILLYIYIRIYIITSLFDYFVYIYTYICVLIYWLIYFYILLVSLARQAAFPPPRNYTEFLSVILQTTTEHVAENPSQPSPNRSNNGAESMNQRCRIDEKTSLERWRRRNVILWGRPQGPWSTGPIHGLHFGSQNHKTNVKNTIKKHTKNEHPKTWTLMPKGQQGNKIDAKTHPKSMPKYVSTNIMNIIKNQVSLNGKIIQIHNNNQYF